MPALGVHARQSTLTRACFFAGGWTESELRGLLVGLIEEDADAKAKSLEAAPI